MKGLLFIILAAACWAIDTLFRYPLLGKGVSALQIVLFEHVILCLIFIPFFLKFIKKIWSLSVAEVFYFFVIGFFASGVGTLCFTKAMMFLNPSVVIVLQKTQPLIALSLSSLILREQINTPFIRWAILCLIGGLMISSNDLLAFYEHIKNQESLFDLKSFQGYFFALSAAACWGAATVFGKKLSNLNFSVTELLTGRFYAALIGLIPLSISNFDQNIIMLHGKHLLLMVLFSGLLGMFFYYQGLKEIKAKLATLAEMLFPFFAIILNWIFLGASLNMVQLAGACLLLVGSFMIQYKSY